MDAPDWVASSIAFAALVIAGLSWQASRRAAIAAEKSAEAARRTAAVDEANLEAARQERAAADLKRRLNVWGHHRVTSDAVEFKFLGAEAHHIRFEANVVLRVERRKSDVFSPMYKGDRMTVVVQDPAGWNKRVTVTWAESDAPDAERLSNLYVV